MVVDARRANAQHKPPPVASLASANVYNDMFVDIKHAHSLQQQSNGCGQIAALDIHGNGGDVSDCFYNFLNRDLADYFAFNDPITVSDLRELGIHVDCVWNAKLSPTLELLTPRYCSQLWKPCAWDGAGLCTLRMRQCALSLHGQRPMISLGCSESAASCRPSPPANQWQEFTLTTSPSSLLGQRTWTLSPGTCRPMQTKQIFPWYGPTIMRCSAWSPSESTWIWSTWSRTTSLVEFGGLISPVVHSFVEEGSVESMCRSGLATRLRFLVSDVQASAYSTVSTG